MLQRPEALRLLAQRYPEQPTLLTLGGTIREMLAVSGLRGNYLPILDSMGQPAAIGLGLAMGLEEADGVDRVIVVEGDGSMLMGLSSIATIGYLRPKKLLVVIFDNGVYLATGGQPTAAAGVDYIGLARACGWPAARELTGGINAFRRALDWADTRVGPTLLRVRVGTETVDTDYYLEDPAVLGRSFVDWVQSATTRV